MHILPLFMKVIENCSFAISGQKWSDMARVLHRNPVEYAYLQLILVLTFGGFVRVTVRYPSLQCL